MCAEHFVYIKRIDFSCESANAIAAAAATADDFAYAIIVVVVIFDIFLFFFKPISTMVFREQL